MVGVIVGDGNDQEDLVADLLILPIRIEVKIKMVVDPKQLGALINGRTCAVSCPLWASSTDSVSRLEIGGIKEKWYPHMPT